MPSTDHQRAAARRPRRRDPALQEARAELVVMRRLAGADVDTIAEEFGISKRTVYSAIDYAKRHDIFERARGFIIQGLMPKALLVYDQALDKCDLDAARDVVQGLALLPKAAAHIASPIDAGGDGTETLEIWRERYYARRSAPASEAGPSSAGSGAGVDGLSVLDAQVAPGSGPEAGE